MYKIVDPKGATATIFVPYDCHNNCPFCINKEEYSDKTGFSLPKIIESIKIIHGITPNCNFVLTGGEPLADLLGFYSIIDAIPKTHKIFINTSLPVKNTFDLIELIYFLNLFKDQISCINISKHIQNYVEDCDPSILKMFKIPYRINCVLEDNNLPDISTLVKYINKYQSIDNWIQFRKDYTTTTLENVHDLKDDKIFKILNSIYDYQVPFNVEKIRIGYEFLSPKKEFNQLNHTCKITYHKTLPYSKIRDVDGNFILYDIIIKQDGRIEDDWNGYGSILDLKDYKHAVNKCGCKKEK